MRCGPDQLVNMPNSLKALFLIVAALMVGLWSCVPKTPEVPTWEVEFNLPLSENRTTLAEIVERTEELIVGPDSLLGFRLEEEIQTIVVGESLTVESLIEEVDTAYLGNMTIRPDEAETTGIGLTEIWSEAGNFHGQKVIIGETVFPEINKDLLPYDYFDSLGVHSGEVALSVKNDSILQIVNLQLFLLDDVDSSTVGSVTIDTLRRGQEATRTITIADDTLSNDFSVRLTADNFSSGGDSVTIDSTSQIDLVVDFPTDLEVNFAKSRIPTQTFEKVDSVGIPNMSIESAQIYSGNVGIEIDSYLPIQSRCVLTFPNLRREGSVVWKSFLLGPGVTDTVTISLSGAEFSSNRSGPTPYLQVQLADSTVDTGTGKVTLRSEDYISAEIRVAELQLESLTGVLESTRLGLTPFREEIDMPAGLTGIELQDPSLSLNLRSSGDFPVIFDLSFLGANERGQTRVLNLQDTLHFTGGQGVATFDKNNSTLVDFLEIMPSRIVLDLDESSMFLGDGVSQITAYRADSIAGEMLIESPMWAVIAQTGFHGRETEIEEIEIEKEFTTQLLSGEIQVTLYNHLPFGISRILFHLSEYPESVYSPNPEVTISLGSLSPGIFDSTGRVIAPDTTVGRVTLTEEELDIFRNPSKESKYVYLGYRVVSSGTGGEAVKVYQSDYLEHKSNAKLRMRLTEHDF
jgi:hypothetical protein